MDATEAQTKIFEMINAELELQNQMWGPNNERADISQGQLFGAGYALLTAVKDRRQANADAFHVIPETYPKDWSGFRSYGTDIPNGVVAICFLINEAKRLLMDGVDPTRVARRPDQKYNAATGLPNTVEPEVTTAPEASTESSAAEA
ncbi:hypothetical protein [Bradyrhizobium sp. DASA03007]|uniref:hypothetical protein n=1 Tax=unclassified Bradyrhizobium TaxID=2631580 RepID=UPI003F6F8F0B